MQQHRVHPLNEEFSLWQGGEFTPNRAPSLIIESYLDSSQGQEGDHDRPHLLVLFVSLQSRRLELSSKVSLCVCALAVDECLKLWKDAAVLALALRSKWHIISAAMSGPGAHFIDWSISPAYMTLWPSFLHRQTRCMYMTLWLHFTDRQETSKQGVAKRNQKSQVIQTRPACRAVGNWFLLIDWIWSSINRLQFY